MKITIDKNGKTPLYMQIAAMLKNQILSGELAVGSTLPSERVLAQILGVHRNTIIKAYNEIKAEELIDSFQGVGYLVSAGQNENAENVAESSKNKKAKSVNWTSQIKDEYLDMEITFDDLFQRFSDESKISMGSGISAPGIYDEEEIVKRIAALISEEGKNQYFYSPYKGDKFLRQKLVSFLSMKGVKASSGEIQIVTETNQALDFIVMLLIKTGDTVIMEEPVSPDAYRAMELGGARIVTVPVDKDGMETNSLERLVNIRKPKLIYVNSSFHDPTGSILTLERRKKIIDISNKYRIPIVEEDAASELVYEGKKLPPIKSLDTAQNVIYIYSFSLTFVPGLSLAFIVADKNVIRSLSYLVSVRMMAVDWLSQKLIAGYLDDGSYYGLLNIFRKDYYRKQSIVCNALDSMKHLGIEYRKPRGGVYIWCKLPPGIDCKHFINKAYKNGISLLPGYIFYPFKNGGRDHIRINYSYETDEKIKLGMQIFKKLIESELAHKK